MKSVLPKPLRGPVCAAMDDALTQARIVPSVAMFSRRCVVLDVSEMACMREDNDSRQMDGTSRYVMADSSNQHGRDFEHIAMLEVSEPDLRPSYCVQVFGDSCAVVGRW